ncbi:recombinase family protein [Streptomyces albireticuli]|nr:recombinase family protein [Streptomyces albireticuli]
MFHATPPAPQRVILSARLSRDGDKSTSIERQLNVLRTWAIDCNHHVVAEVEDRSVSGGMAPWKRPKLGQWLKPEAIEQWDLIAVSTQDRMSRNDLQFMAFVQKIMDWGKNLIIIDDPSFDILSPEGRMIAYAKATMATKELERITKRIMDSQQYLREKGFYGGGWLPAGYIPVLDAASAHKTLQGEGYFSPILRNVAMNFLGAPRYSISQAVRELREQEIPSWSAYVRENQLGSVSMRADQESSAWHVTPLKRMLMSPTMAGIQIHKGKPVEDHDTGEYKLFTDTAHLSYGEWSAVLEILKGKEKKTTRERGDAALLSTVSACGNCLGPQYRNRDTVHSRGKVYRYDHYRCRGKTQHYGEKCEYKSKIDSEFFEEFFTDTIKDRFADHKEYEKVTIAGEDHAAEIADVEKRITRLRRQFEAGDWDDEEDEYRERLKTLKARKKALGEKPSVPAKVEIRETGRGWLDVWNGMKQGERRQYLLDNHVKILVFHPALTGMEEMGVVVHLGNLQELAKTAGVAGADTDDWVTVSYNVPPHWTKPALLDDPDMAKVVEAQFGSTKIPKSLYETGIIQQPAPKGVQVTSQLA